MRRILHADIRFVDGFALELITDGNPVVLIHRDWKDLYFLNSRAGWTDDDYFRFAEMLLKERGIAP